VAPQAVLIWIDILPRLQWEGAHRPTKEIEKNRKRINRWGRQQARRNTKFDSLTADINETTPGFYRDDGVHLSDVGNEFLLDAVRDIIFKYL
jgi:lysophospholipase L1-like esterase